MPKLIRCGALALGLCLVTAPSMAQATRDTSTMVNDAWITNGMSRYSELMYLEESAGKTAFESAITDVSAGALAYDTEPLTTLGRLDPFSPHGIETSQRES